jgi:superfamily I DNA/RNA helicase
LRVAEAAIVKNRRRFSKEMKAFRPGGAIEIIVDPRKALQRALDVAEKRTVYVLARSKELLATAFEGSLAASDIPYRFLGGAESIWQSSLKTAVAELLGLRETGTIFPSDLKTILDHVFQRDRLTWGMKARVERLTREPEQPILTLAELLLPSWEELGRLLVDTPVEALLQKDAQPEHVRKFLRVAQKEGRAALLEEPRIALGTKHSAKGLEAPIVVSLESEEVVGNSPEVEAERRVQYVARSRASEALFIVPVGPRL